MLMLRLWPSMPRFATDLILLLRLRLMLHLASHRYVLVDIHQEQFIFFLLIFFSSFTCWCKSAAAATSAAAAAVVAYIFFIRHPKSIMENLRGDTTNQMRINRNNNMESVCVKNGRNNGYDAGERKSDKKEENEKVNECQDNKNNHAATTIITTTSSRERCIRWKMEVNKIATAFIRLLAFRPLSLITTETRSIVWISFAITE